MTDDNEAALPEEPSARTVYLTNAGDLAEHAARYLDEVREAIDATPHDDHRRPAMLTLKVEHAHACTALASVLVELAMLDELDEAEDDVELEQAELELDEHDAELEAARLQPGIAQQARARCNASSHAGSSLHGRTCGRRLNHRGMHAQRDEQGEVVRW